jgi:DNA/RNA endonuclease G (NUC1)
VAAVDQKGQVRAESGGTAIITARAGDKTATCTVTVTVPVEKISLDRTSVTLKVDESVTLTATVKPSDATDKTVSWSSSNPAIAKVENGKVTAISEGAATITAKAGEKTATCSVTVVKPDEPDTPGPDDPDPDDPDEPSATGIVNTMDATNVNTVGATLNAYCYQVTGAVQEAGFYWGTSPYVLSGTVWTSYPPTGESGYFSADLTSLQPGTTYYYKAFIVEYDAATGEFVDRMGAVRSFTTETPAAAAGTGYLSCYEMPAVSLDGTGDSGYKYGKWWSYGTTNPMQRVVTRTYMYNGRQYRNYTVLVDGTRRAPLWTVHVAHRGAYPKNQSGRGSWDYDPAVPSSWQQSGVSGISGFGNYSKGHFVASSDRQTTNDANDQTFLYTNQAPQWQNGFNSGLWSTLETAIQDKAPSSASDTLYVVTGVLYEGAVQKAGSVPIPSHFYKCLMKCSFSGGQMTTAKGCAYIYTNESHTGESYSNGLTSIDAIEARAGFDFFANVPAALQNAAETTSTSIW